MKIGYTRGYELLPEMVNASIIISNELQIKLAERKEYFSVCVSKVESKLAYWLMMMMWITKRPS